MTAAADKFLAEVKALKTDTPLESVQQLCREEPEWAANRLLHERKMAHRLVAMVEAARKALADIACCHGEVPGEGHRTYDRTDMHMRARRAEAELDRIAGGGA